MRASQLLASVLSLVSLGSLASCDGRTSLPDEQAGIQRQQDTSACNSSYGDDLFIVAHPDDDLLFMNPAISDRINASAACGNRVVVAYLTSGQNNWQLRERGLKKAYSSMIGTTLEPSSQTLLLDGHTVRLQQFPGGNVSLVFLRLPNYYINSDERAVPGTHLSVLWAGVWTSLTSTAGDGLVSETYTKTGLVDALANLIEIFDPDSVQTLDSSDVAPPSLNSNPSTYDHYDHVASAEFAFEANRRAHGFAERRFAMHRGYPIEFGPPFLSSGQRTAKEAAYREYGACDAGVCSGTCGVCPASVVLNHCVLGGGDSCGTQDARGAFFTFGWGSLQSTDSQCLDIPGANYNSPANGLDLQTWNCVPGAQSQRWRLIDGRIEAMGGAKCLDIERGSSWDGLGTRPVQVWDCADVAAQRWTLVHDQVRGRYGTCLTRSNQGNGSQVYATACTHDLASFQTWTALMPPTRRISQAGDFADSSGIDSSASYYASLDFGEQNGTSACVRRSDGYWCASTPLDANGKLGSWSRRTQEYSDAHGWSPEDHGTTVQLGRVNSDAYDDVCGRGDSGLVCAMGSGSGAFQQSQLATQAFRNSSGWDSSMTRYATIRLTDVTGDGLADACGRSTTGIVCAENLGNGQFSNTEVPWLTADFGDNKGYGALQYGTTVRFGDLNGDGRADVCARGSAGIRCATSNGQAFVDVHQWSADFTDAQGWAADPTYYRSLQLEDMNGDGFADLCGRDASGLWCAYSSGSNAFAPKQLVTPQSFNTSSWAQPRYGLTLRLTTIAGAPSICARDASGLLCTGW